MTKRLRLLVVDDDASFSEAVSVTFKSEVDVQIASGLEDCKKKFTADTPFDIVITDFKMAGGDGHAVLAHARKIVPAIPVILVTAHAAKEMAIQSVNLNVFAFLEKPIDFFELTDTVKRAADSRGLTTSGPKRLGEVTQGNYVLKPVNFTITHHGLKFQLTETEFRILHAFVCAEGLRVSRDDLIRSVWGTSQLSTNLFDTHLANLRKKVPSLKEDLRVVRGKGYQFSSKSEF